MDAVDLSVAEAEAAAQQSKGTANGAEYANIFFSFRDLLTAAGDDNNDNTVETTATAIANFIREGARQVSVPRDDCFLSCCWENMMTMIYGIPPNHPWHTIFVRTIHILYGLVDEPIYSQTDWAHYTWDELGSLQYHFWDFWDGMMPCCYIVTEKRENPEAHEEVARWKCWTSLFAQMPRDIAIPYYALRAIQPLESPITAVCLIEAECDLWTACEWLIHNAYTALECLRYHAIHKEGRALLMGEMYRKDVGDPCSLKRWYWWKHRLEELAADVDTEAKQRVAKALASMEAAEAQPSEGLGRVGITYVTSALLPAHAFAARLDPHRIRIAFPDRLLDIVEWGVHYLRRKHYAHPLPVQSPFLPLLHYNGPDADEEQRHNCEVDPEKARMDIDNILQTLITETTPENNRETSHDMVEVSDQLAKQKLGTVAKESIFMKTIIDNFMPFYEPLIPLLNRLRKIVFPKDKPWEREDKKLYSRMKGVLRQVGEVGVMGGRSG
ncbi:hypothetical protein B0T24DRAFT_680191 [Lasiosphaeria ovina]|uniref:Uncharacterized protein n=1 Tax=Lasiosphaeria ovina TaxID=92902 RepID=A0AAE0N5M4_9PEZI|nr:hypothetical protein B0T24DRAFT_680191 [Lasiosphaeria ovina]